MKSNKAGENHHLCHQHLPLHVKQGGGRGGGVGKRRGEYEREEGEEEKETRTMRKGRGK